MSRTSRLLEVLLLALLLVDGFVSPMVGSGAAETADTGPAIPPADGPIGWYPDGNAGTLPVPPPPGDVVIHAEEQVVWSIEEATLDVDFPAQPWNYSIRLGGPLVGTFDLVLLERDADASEQEVSLTRQVTPPDCPQELCRGQLAVPHAFHVAPHELVRLGLTYHAPTGANATSSPPKGPPPKSASVTSASARTTSNHAAPARAASTSNASANASSSTSPQGHANAQGNGAGANASAAAKANGNGNPGNNGNGGQAGSNTTTASNGTAVTGNASAGNATAAPGSNTTSAAGNQSASAPANPNATSSGSGTGNATTSPSNTSTRGNASATNASTGTPSAPSDNSTSATGSGPATGNATTSGASTTQAHASAPANPNATSNGAGTSNTSASSGNTTQQGDASSAQAAAPAAAAKGNAPHGTIKVHDDATAQPETSDEPHVSCGFWIEGSDMQDGNGSVTFYAWSGTGDHGVVTSEGVAPNWTGHADRPGGYAFLQGPFYLPEGHFRIEAFSNDGHPGSVDHFAKTKTFWVDRCGSATTLVVRLGAQTVFETSIRKPLLPTPELASVALVVAGTGALALVGRRGATRRTMLQPS